MNSTYDYANDYLKHRFSGYTKVFQNYSQAYQDLFVLSMLNGKKNGKYVEIGSNDPQWLDLAVCNVSTYSDLNHCLSTIHYKRYLMISWY